MSKAGEQPPVKLGNLIKGSTGKTRTEGPIVQTQITRGNKTIFVETPTKLEIMYKNGTRNIMWRKKEGVELDGYPVYAIAPTHFVD